MLMLTEEDVENKTNYRGGGFEILILPSKYKNVDNSYLDILIKLALARRGEVIYI